MTKYHNVEMMPFVLQGTKPLKPVKISPMNINYLLPYILWQMMCDWTEVIWSFFLSPYKGKSIANYYDFKTCRTAKLNL